MTIPKPAEIKKLLVYIAGVIAAVVATGLLPATAAAIADAVLAVLTGIGIHQATNATPPFVGEASPPPAP